MLRKQSLISAKMKARRGQGLVEYIVIVAAVAMIALIAVSIFGHKVADQYAIGAGMLPGAHAEDNKPITTGSFAEADTTGDSATATGAVSWSNITGNSELGEMDNNVIATGESGSINNTADAFVAD